MPPHEENVLSEIKDCSNTNTLNSFKDKYEAHVNMILEKRMKEAEEEQKRKEQELLEAQLKEQEELKAAENPEEAKKEEEKTTEEKKEEINPEDPEEVRKSEENEVGFDSVQPIKKEDIPESMLILPDPAIFPIPELIPISENLIFKEANLKEHSLVIKVSNNISGTELMILPLIHNSETSGYSYKEFVSVHGRIRKQRYKFEGEDDTSIVEAEGMPLHIGTYFSDVYEPLRREAWNAWIEDITQLNSIGYMTIPPIDVKWPCKMDGCVMHILPLPNKGLHGFNDSKVPIDDMIMSVADYEKTIAEDKGEFIMFTLSMNCNNY